MVVMMMVIGSSGSGDDDSSGDDYMMMSWDKSILCYDTYVCYDIYLSLSHSTITSECKTRCLVFNGWQKNTSTSEGSRST